MAIFYAPETNTSENFPQQYSRRTVCTDTVGANACITSLSVTNYKSEFGSLALRNYVKVPESHKRVADSYVIVRQVFGTPVVHSALSEEDRMALTRFDFYPLEYTTAKQMQQEIDFLKKWSKGSNFDLKRASDNVVNIRSKELKHLIATNFVSVKRGLYDGYKVLDRYFQEISKYNRKN